MSSSVQPGAALAAPPPTPPVEPTYCNRFVIKDLCDVNGMDSDQVLQIVAGAMTVEDFVEDDVGILLPSFEDVALEVCFQSQQVSQG